jgi:hypothetical protein
LLWLRSGTTIKRAAMRKSIPKTEIRRLRILASLE